jgi:L-aminopeptidase/D-esterase-like protein
VSSTTPRYHNAITDVPGLLVGHAQDDEALTGCTVVLVPDGATGGVDQRGGAPGTRETDGMHPLHLVTQVHAVVLSGGSAFGLDAATGAVRFLEERGVGFDTGVARVPIVPAAILYDLGIGRSDVRPDAAMGYQACLNASSDPPAEGNIGAGTGATVGKALGMTHAMKSGVGTAGQVLGEGLVVAALCAVNSFGDVVDPSTGQIVAGARNRPEIPPPPGEPVFADSLEILRARAGQSILEFRGGGNTVIGIVATNAQLDKEQVTKVSQMAQDGVARAIRPAHTMLDGDTVFALATGPLPADVNIIGAIAAEVIAQSILRAVRAARPAGGLPAIGELFP